MPNFSDKLCHTLFTKTEVSAGGTASGLQRSSPGQKLPGDLGCNVVSPIPDMLDYVDYSAIWVLPVAHLLLHGVVATYWKMMLFHVQRGESRPPYALPNATRRLLQARGAEIEVTADFGRPYRQALHAESLLACS